MFKKYFLSSIALFLISLGFSAFGAGVWQSGHQVQDGFGNNLSVIDVTQQTVQSTRFLLALTENGLYYAIGQTDGTTDPDSPWSWCANQDTQGSVANTIGIPKRVFGPSNWGPKSFFAYVAADARNVTGASSGLSRYYLDPNSRTCTRDNSYNPAPSSGPITTNKYMAGGFVPPNHNVGVDTWIYLLERTNLSVIPNQDILWVSHDGGTNWTATLQPGSTGLSYFNDVFRDPVADDGIQYFDKNIYVAVSGDKPGLFYIDDQGVPLLGLLAQVLDPAVTKDLYRVHVRHRIATLEPVGTEVYTGGTDGLWACFNMNFTSSPKTCQDAWQNYKVETNRCTHGQDLAGNLITGIFAHGDYDGLTHRPEIAIASLNIASGAKNIAGKSYEDVLSTLGFGSKSCHLKKSNDINGGGLAILDISSPASGACSSQGSGFYTETNSPSLPGLNPGTLVTNDGQKSLARGVSGSILEHHKTLDDGDNYLVGIEGEICDNGLVNYSAPIEP